MHAKSARTDPPTARAMVRASSELSSAALLCWVVVVGDGGV